MTTTASLEARLAAAETARIALATELATTQRTLWIERGRRLHDVPDAAVEFITATNEAGITDQLEVLARHVSPASPAHTAGRR